MRGKCRIWGLLGVLLLAGLTLWDGGTQTAQSASAQSGQFASWYPLVTAASRPSPLSPQTSPSSLLRLTNTVLPAGKLLANPRAILLENAWFDTTQPIVPPSLALQAPGDPQAYIVQARNRPDQAFRTLLTEAGAIIVAYIPNQAYLVRAPESAARSLESSAMVQSVLPYQPHYKLKADLLRFAAQGLRLPTASRLNVLLFPGSAAATRADLERLGAIVLAQDRSPFGPVLQLRLPAAEVAGGEGLLPPLARLPGVQEIELAHARLPANDLLRATTGVAPNAVCTNTYLDLTGAHVLVAVNDTGVDATHPDLAGRVSGDSPNSLQDADGHGTHVAGVIAGAGLDSVGITNASGSKMPAVNRQFRGMAPAARLFATAGGTDSYLQESAASTNALISNNSWTYATGGYDLAAASYDAAARDALPTVSGAQPVLFVFAAGNAGNGDDDGTGGQPDSILSPATAKNVITVGALEQARHLTNSVWGRTTNSWPSWQTNQPWLALTGSSNRVAGFSSRGNVGLGVEGDFGRFKPDLVAPGVFVVSTCSQDWDEAAYYSPTNTSLVFSDFGNTLEVLSNLNYDLGAPPMRYRYESGTSMAAGCVAGALALMQEFFQQRLGLTNSPALMKALLINGARPPAMGGDLCVTNPLNIQGWGRLNLLASLPAGLTNPAPPGMASTLFWSDQDPATALATGESHTRFITLSAAAQGAPLRVSLVWTDPPGNPIAGVKLVNDLDLSVTNLDTGQVFWGNDIPSGSVTNAAWDPATIPNLDQVNNVENVFLQTGFGAHYSVTVTARGVNVNADAERTDAVVQDYALVIAVGDGTLTNALTVADSPIATGGGPQLTVLTNRLGVLGPDAGAVLLGERAGASNPLPGVNTIPLSAANGAITIGDPNQWHFYVLTNDTGYTNAVFLTFLARRLSLDGLDLTDLGGTNATPAEADIDLYVSMEAALTNLDPGALEGADKSLGRGGTESIVYTNAVAGVYFIGVKCESRQGAEYGFAGIFSQIPFSEIDSNGNETLRGFPAPAVLPPASGSQPGVGRFLAVAAQPTALHRAVVTNTVTHQTMGDLVGVLSHLGTSVVLNNHDTNPPVVAWPFVYDDSPEADIAGSQHTDGPGGLNDFCAQTSAGQWMLQENDPVAGLPGIDDSLSIWLEPQPDLQAGFTASILAGAGRNDYFNVPVAATNLAIAASLLSGTGPLTLQVWPASAGPGFSQSCPVTAVSGGWLVIDKTVNPPLNPGLYVMSLSNLGPDTVTVSNWAGSMVDPNGGAPTLYTSTGAVLIADAAVTKGFLNVQDGRKVVTAEVGVRIDHPRISDLAIYLVNPSGTRVLLDENRGAASPDGMGQDIIVTNVTPVSSSGGPAGYTNVVNTGQTSGAILIEYHFYSDPDEMRVYYEGTLIYDSGLVSFDGLTNVVYGPGTDTHVTIIMNEGGVIDPNDAWDYTITATQPGFLYTTFTEDTNLTLTPIKFAIPPLNSYSPAPGGGPANGIFYLPEESLGGFTGAGAEGQWTLEIEDTRAGPAGATAALLGWQLALRLADSVPTPIPLVHHQPHTNTIAAGQTQYFTVPVPSWANFATNSLLAATAPLSLIFNASEPPDAILKPDDFVLLSNSSHGMAVLASNGNPPALTPGTTYFLGVRNTNASAVTFSFEVDFDVPVLADGVPVGVVLEVDSQPRYFAYDASSNATLVTFQLQNLSANADLYVDYGLPFPTTGTNTASSTNPGTNDEETVFLANSFPDPLCGRRWYLGVFNADITSVTGTILANEYAVFGTNVTITSCQISSNMLWLTWGSVPGTYYHVMGATGLAGGSLVPISPTLVAFDYQTSFSVPLPSAFQTLVVSDGAAPGGDLTPPTVALPIVTSTGVQLQWTAGTKSQFLVQWSPTLSPTAWTTFSGVVSSATGAFSFLDDGSQTGGLDNTRFYRLIVVP